MEDEKKERQESEEWEDGMYPPWTNEIRGRIFKEKLIDFFNDDPLARMRAREVLNEREGKMSIELAEARQVPIDLNQTVPGGSVKIMISYDYNHFEVCLGVREGATLEEVNQTRKDAQRLADEAVRQYKEAKRSIAHRLDLTISPYELGEKAKIVQENYPKSEWTEAQKAIVKAHEDYLWDVRHPYNYEDDWEEQEYDPDE